MNKKLILIALFTMLVMVMFAQRVYTQKVVADDPAVNIYGIVTNTSSSTSPNYIIDADILETPGEILTTEAGNPNGKLSMPVSTIRINRLGTAVVTVLQLASFPTPFVIGQTVQMTVKYIPTNETTSWTMVIPAGTAAITILNPAQEVPPLTPVVSDTYTYNLTVNGPVGYTVTGPGTYAGAMGTTFTCGPNPTDINDLLGDWTASDPAPGTWLVSPLTVTADMFTPAKTDYVKNATITFVWVPAPDIYTYTLNVAGPAGYSVAGPSGPMPFPATFVAPDTDMENELLGTYTPVGAAPVGFHWEPASIEVTEGMFSAGKAALVQGSRSASSKATYNYVANISFALVADPPTYDCPEGVETPLYPGITITVITGNANFGPGAPPTPPTNPLFVPEHIQFFNLIGAGPWLLQFNTTSNWVWVVGYGVFAGPGLISIPIPATKDQIIEVQFGGGGDPTLPVELSSFTAVLTAQNFVKLTWVSQSETEMLGYRVYRGESGDQASAIMITPTMEPATNTSTTQTYSITDNEVTIGSTYWYWLESVDYASSHFHGPVSIIVEGEVPPVLPEVTSMKNAYPNPFRMNSSTNIEVAVKAGENGIVTVYNILGQAVKTFKVSEGTTRINWNGRDAKGNACGSGIYFYKLSTPSTNVTKKMVIVK